MLGLKKSPVSIFMVGTRNEGLYKVCGSPIRALVQDSSHQRELWHRRFAHLHYETLPKVRKMVFGMLEIRVDHDGVCQRCASGKHVKGPFSSSRSKTNGILRFIHSDLYGPVPVISLGCYLYYIIFVDDFSRKTWIFFLKNKDQAFDMFRVFKALVESQTKKKIKILRTVNGGEFTSNEFIDFCNKGRIMKETILPYNPEQNSVAKRKNNTIMEAARAMLHDQKLPKFL